MCVDGSPGGAAVHAPPWLTKPGTHWHVVVCISQYSFAPHAGVHVGPPVLLLDCAVVVVTAVVGPALEVVAPVDATVVVVVVVFAPVEPGPLAPTPVDAPSGEPVPVVCDVVWPPAPGFPAPPPDAPPSPTCRSPAPVIALQAGAAARISAATAVRTSSGVRVRISHDTALSGSSSSGRAAAQWTRATRAATIDPC